MKPRKRIVPGRRMPVKAPVVAKRPKRPKSDLPSALGGITAFAIEPGTDALQQLNHRASPPGRGPSHLGLDRTGRFIFDANYGQGHARVHALAADGSLGEQTALVLHAGSSVHPQRQNKPYAHCILASPDNRFVLVADLGMDQLVVYRFDEKSGALTPNRFLTRPACLVMPPIDALTPQRCAYFSRVVRLVGPARPMRIGASIPRSRIFNDSG